MHIGNMYFTAVSCYQYSMPRDNYLITMGFFKTIFTTSCYGLKSLDQIEYKFPGHFCVLLLVRYFSLLLGSKERRDILGSPRQLRSVKQTQ